MDKNSIFFFGVLFIFTACSIEQKSPQVNEDETGDKPNVILMIGDGMGLTQVSTVYYFGDQEPQFSRFSVTGLQNSSSAKQKITDSAAGATAFSAGKRTYNGAIGVDVDTIPLPTIMEDLYDQGYQTGLIATSSITHATPASFYAHVPFRKMEEDIAKQLFESDKVDFFAGGGLQFFNNRRDSINYLDSLIAKGFVIDTNELSQTEQLDASKKYGYLLADDGMKRMLDGRGDFLPEATRLALNMFGKNEEPFFLMVEGSQIDWGGHANDADYLISEALDFNKAIKEALDFAQKEGNTLVVVTADHECGGLALSAAEIKGFGGQSYADYDSIAPAFTSSGHSCALIPVFADGPGAEAFTGVYNNTEIYDKIVKALE